MTAADRTLTVASAAERVRATTFQPAPHERVGIETELLAVNPDGSRAPHELVAEVLAGLGPLASGTPVTFEPGGQVELSTLPAGGVDAACDGLAADLARLGEALGRHGVTLAGVGLDPFPARGRVLHSARYDAMARFFGPQGPAGTAMMCLSAGIQVNLDWGPTALTAAARWELSHLVGPVLAASFANSPLADGGPTGWKSTRLANWWQVDPSRTAPVGGGTETWVDYALAARVLLVRSPSGRAKAVREPLSFAAWATDGHGGRFPTADDLDYHLTTLFPPIRPRAWMELRIFDSLPDPWWRVPVAVSAALLLDDAAAERAARATRNMGGLWEQASRAGLSDPRLAAAASECFKAAIEALPRLGVAAATVDVVGRYADRYVNRRCCPADDILEAWAATGDALVPSAVAATATAASPVSSAGRQR